MVVRATVGDPAQRARQSGDGADPLGCGVECQPPQRRGRDRRRPLGGGWEPVGEVYEHGQTADAICEHVVEDHDHRPPPARQAGDHGCAPQWPRPIQPGGDQVGGEVVQGTVVTGGRARQRVDVVGDVERRVIDPDRTPTAERHGLQPLPQSGHARDPRGDRVACGVGFRGRASQQQHRADLRGHAAAVVGQLQHVVGRCPLDRGVRAAGQRPPGWVHCRCHRRVLLAAHHPSPRP